VDGMADSHGDLLAAFPGAISAECDGRGSVNVTAHDDRLDHPYVRSAQCPVCARLRLRRAIGAFIPPRFSKLIDIPQAVTGWAENGKSAQGLYLAGPVGTGKTHTAWTALAIWCLATGTMPRGETREDDWLGDGRIRPTVIFTRMTDLLDDLRPGDDARQRVRDCQLAGLLVLDDLGAEKASEWTQERLYSVVDHRYANCMPLIVTGNLPPAKLAEQTGDRTASRLAEMCQVVPVTGADRRRAS
jgi:DNA replication protein DnaC